MSELGNELAVGPTNLASRAGVSSDFQSFSVGGSVLVFIKLPFLRVFGSEFHLTCVTMLSTEGCCHKIMEVGALGRRVEVSPFPFYAVISVASSPPCFTTRFSTQFWRKSINKHGPNMH